MTNDWARPYWSGVEERELRIPWCTDCGEPHFPPRPFCPGCWGNRIEWRRASGRGTLYSYTVVRSNPPSGFRDRLPFAIGIVRLEEGVRMLSNIEGDLATMTCDMPVEVGFHDIDGRTLPCFYLRNMT